MKEYILLARELVEKFLGKIDIKLSKEHFFMFSISKFLLLKEKIVKKNSSNGNLYFDNITDRRYISSIIELANYINSEVSNGKAIYTFNKSNVIFKDPTDNNATEELKKAIWIFNKIRDSFAHGKYYFNLENDEICINNVSTDPNNSYSFTCNIPLSLLNSISFYINELVIDTNESNITTNYTEYQNYIESMFNYKENNKKYIDSLKNKNQFKKNKVIYNEFNSSSINNTENYNSNNEIEKKLLNLTNTLNIDDLIFLILKLSNKSAYSVNEKQTIELILKKIKALLNIIDNKKNIKIDEYIAKSTLLIHEMADILGLNLKDNNADLVIALFNYMGLTLAQDIDIDYSHLRVKDLEVDFDPLSNNQGTGLFYKNNIRAINNKINGFINASQDMLSSYNNHPSESFRHSLMEQFTSFYLSLMDSLGNKNKLIINSIRNSIEHGNYYVDNDYGITLYDQTDHSNNQTIKFTCKTKIDSLYEITKSIESNDKVYTIGDLFNEIESIIDPLLFIDLKNTINNYSLIIFGKELNINFSIEQMYQEAIATILNKLSHKKRQS